MDPTDGNNGLHAPRKPEAVPEFDADIKIAMPEMDSQEGDRNGPEKRTASKKKQREEKKGADDERNLGLFEQSPSSTF